MNKFCALGAKFRYLNPQYYCPTICSKSRIQYFINWKFILNNGYLNCLTFGSTQQNEGYSSASRSPTVIIIWFRIKSIRLSEEHSWLKTVSHVHSWMFRVSCRAWTSNIDPIFLEKLIKSKAMIMKRGMYRALRHAISLSINRAFPSDDLFPKCPERLIDFYGSTSSFLMLWFTPSKNIFYHSGKFVACWRIHYLN